MFWSDVVNALNQVQNDWNEADGIHKEFNCKLKILQRLRKV